MKKILSLAVALLVTTSLYAVPPQEKGDMPEPPHQHFQKMGPDFEKIAKDVMDGIIVLNREFPKIEKEYTKFLFKK